MMSMDAPQISAVLLIAPSCPHCAGILQVLSKLLALGDIGFLEIALPYLKALEYGENSDVREIAVEALDAFGSGDLR